jgi:hypothetical protein
MTMANAVPGADQLYLLIGPSTIAVQCRTHPQYSETHPYDADQPRVPGTWVVAAMFKHLQDHAATAEAPTAEAAAPVATAGTGLDGFAREVASRCRWAMDHNKGDPDDSWPINLRLAVALVLGNQLYLRDIGPGPGYSAADAAVLLAQGMTNRPQDLDAWISGIRQEIRRLGEQATPGLWLPSTAIPTTST